MSSADVESTGPYGKSPIIISIDGQIKELVEFRKNPDGQYVKIIRKIKMSLIKHAVKPAVAERKSWKKYGDAVNDPPGPNTASTVIGEPVFLKLSFKAIEETEKQPKAEAKAITCQLCGGLHWTARCPHKDKFKDTLPANVSRMEEPSEGKSGKYVPPSMRGKQADASGHQPRDEGNSVRLSNLEGITSENDIRLLCSHFGHINRVYVSKDYVTGQCKGFAFVSFMSKDDAARAVSKLNGYAYGNVIIKAEIAKAKD